MEKFMEKLAKLRKNWLEGAELARELVTEAMTTAIDSIVVSNGVFTANLELLTKLVSDSASLEKHITMLRSYICNRDSAIEWRDGEFRFSAKLAQGLIDGFDGSVANKAALLAVTLRYIKTHNYDQKVELTDAQKADNTAKLAERKAKKEKEHRDEIQRAIELDRLERTNTQGKPGIPSNIALEEGDEDFLEILHKVPASRRAKLINFAMTLFAEPEKKAS